MKIQLFITAFLLVLCSSYAEPSYSIVKGSVRAVSTNYDVVEIANSKKNGSSFEKGKELILTEPWGMTTVSKKGSLHLLFSNKMNAWVGGKTTLWVDNFEQIIDKDDSGKTSIGGSITNFRLNGEITVKLDRITDDGYFNIMTNSADLEIRSTHFYVTSDGGTITEVQCFEGSIKLTNSNTFAVSELEAGNYAVVYGKGGEMNLSVKIFPLTDLMKSQSKERTIDVP